MPLKLVYILKQSEVYEEYGPILFTFEMRLYRNLRFLVSSITIDSTLECEFGRGFFSISETRTLIKQNGDISRQKAAWVQNCCTVFTNCLTWRILPPHYIFVIVNAKQLHVYQFGTWDTRSMQKYNIIMLTIAILSPILLPLSTSKATKKSMTKSQNYLVFSQF